MIDTTFTYKRSKLEDSVGMFGLWTEHPTIQYTRYSTVSNLRSIVTVILLVSIDVFVSTFRVHEPEVCKPVFVETAFVNQ